MNNGLIGFGVDKLRQFLTKRNLITTPFQLQDTTQGSAVGGNARGIGAVDLQMDRNLATQVASGNYSMLFGQNCLASGIQSIAGGAGCSATANQAVALGNGCQATGNQSVALGGSNTASATGSFAVGSNNTASGNDSFATLNRANTNNIVTRFTLGFNSTTNTLGRFQKSTLGVNFTTTNATTTPLTSTGGTATATNQLVLFNNSTFRVRGEVVARDTANGDSKEWVFNALIKRGANAGTTTLVGTPSITSTFADTGAAAWTIAVVADTTNGALQVTATGETGKTIRFLAILESSEVST